MRRLQATIRRTTELGARQVVVVALLLSGLLSAPALRSGFFLVDDEVLVARLGEAHSLLDLYRFGPSPGDADLRGVYPWWTNPDLRIEFARPIAIAALAIEHRLSGTSPTGYHLTSWVAHLGLIGLVGLFLRRFLLGPVGAITLLVLACSDTHAQAIGWVFCGHYLLAALLAMAGLWLHVDGRREKSRVKRLGSLCCFGLALLTSESGLCWLAYPLAYECVGSTGSRRDRMHAAIPLLALALAYVACYQVAGYGARGSAVFFHPTVAPLGFLLHLPVRLAVLLGGLLTGFPVDSVLMCPRWVLLGAVLGLGGSALVLGAARRALAELPAEDAKKVLAFIVGGLLSMVPFTIQPPGARQLIVPSLGLAALFSILLRSGWSKIAARSGAASIRAILWVSLLVAVAVVRPALYLPILLGDLDNARLANAALLRAVGGGAGGRVVAVTMPGIYWPTAIEGVLKLRFDSATRPLAWWTLSQAPHAHRLTRTDARRLELEVQGGAMLDTESERWWYDGDRPLVSGARVSLAGMEAHVLDAGGGRPTRVAFAFDRPLDDPGWRFVAWDQGTWRRLEALPVGSSLVVDPGPVNHGSNRFLWWRRLPCRPCASW